MEKTYNPMSKEFQDECKRFELTGRQLVVKYRKEGKTLEKGVYKKRRYGQSYTKEQLLWYLIQFYEKYGRPPTQEDFNNNFDYPSYDTYRRVFGTWSNALKLVGLDVESMVKKGVIETDDQKARFSEMIIRDSFDNPSVDLAGKNKNNSCDGICPNGKIYDVKSSGLHFDRGSLFFSFVTKNKYKDKIEIYYFLAFNKDYTKLMYGWRIPVWEFINEDRFYIPLTNNWSNAKFTIESMKQYDITDELREVLIQYGFFK